MNRAAWALSILLVLCAGGLATDWLAAGPERRVVERFLEAARASNLQAARECCHPGALVHAGEPEPGWSVTTFHCGCPCVGLDLLAGGRVGGALRTGIDSASVSVEIGGRDVSVMLEGGRIVGVFDHG